MASMARKRRQTIEVFSMSFLDCMSCGFGAVILFFMIINAQVQETTEPRIPPGPDGRDHASSNEVEILEGRKNLVLCQATRSEELEDMQKEDGRRRARSREIVRLIEELANYELAL